MGGTRQRLEGDGPPRRMKVVSDMNRLGLTHVGDVLGELAATEGMRVPGRVYADIELLAALEGDQSLTQVRNVAHLPGILRYSLAMPDIHFGYGFPIGGVAAFAV